MFIKIRIKWQNLLSVWYFCSVFVFMHRLNLVYSFHGHNYWPKMWLNKITDTFSNINSSNINFIWIYDNISAYWLKIGKQAHFPYKCLLQMYFCKKKTPKRQHTFFVIHLECKFIILSQIFDWTHACHKTHRKLNPVLRSYTILRFLKDISTSREWL